MSMVVVIRAFIQCCTAQFTVCLRPIVHVYLGIVLRGSLYLVGVLAVRFYVDSITFLCLLCVLAVRFRPTIV